MRWSGCVGMADGNRWGGVVYQAKGVMGGQDEATSTSVDVGHVQARGCDALGSADGPLTDRAVANGSAASKPPNVKSA